MAAKLGALLYLQIVEDEEERLGGQALVELHSVRVWGRHLVVVGRRRAGVPGQVLPVGDGGVRASQGQWAAAPPPLPAGPHRMRSESEGWGMWCQAASSMACWYSCSLVRGTGPSGHTPSDSGMLTSDSCRGGWAEAGGAALLLRRMSAGQGAASMRPRHAAGLAGPPQPRPLTSLSQVKRGHRVLDARADGCTLCHGLQGAQGLGGLGSKGGWLRPGLRAGPGPRGRRVGLSAGVRLS